MKKARIAALLSLVILASGTTVHAEAAVKNQLTESKRVMEAGVPPCIIKGSILAPLSFIRELNIEPLRFIAELSIASVATMNLEKHAVINQYVKEGGKPASKGTTTIKLDHVSYTLPIISEKFKQYSFAVKTNAGIVWSPAPERAKSNDSSIYYPATPYILYLSDPNVHNLNVLQSKKLIELPSGEKDSFQNLRGIHGVGDYLVYHTTLIGGGMAQAFKSQAWVMKVDEPQSTKEIETFHTAGGYSYSFGIDAQEGLYVSLSQIPDLDGDYSKNVRVYNVATGIKSKVEHYTFVDAKLHFEYEGKKFTVSIEQL